MRELAYTGVQRGLRAGVCVRRRPALGTRGCVRELAYAGVQCCRDAELRAGIQRTRETGARDAGLRAGIVTKHNFPCNS